MKEIEVEAKVSLNVSLNIIVDSVWGNRCTIEQVHKQAKEDALNKVRRMINDTKMGNKVSITDIDYGTIYLTERK